MSKARTYKALAVVLRKTKLGEKDLIVTLLGQDGSLIRAVAKGARKPGGSMAAKFELFNVIDAMFAQGRNLDVVTDARFVPGTARCTFGLEQSACAAPIAELVCMVAQEGLEHPRLYDMTAKAFGCIAGASPNSALAIAAADLLKTLASEGLRPSFDVCVSCAGPVDMGVADSRVAMSFEDGGIVCDSCRRPPQAVLVESRTVELAKAMLYARFDDILEWDVDVRDLFASLQFARQWTRTHAGRDLKSLDFLFTGGLY